MKKLAITLFLILGSLTIQAQELTWQTDMNKAMEISKKTKKPLLLFFTGSDWCGWCMRLQKEVLKTPEFAKWAKDNVVLVELDFPRRTPQLPEIQRQNMELQQTFAVQGYPTVWFVNASKKDGKINLEKIGSTGYVAGGPSAWLAGADQILGNKKS
ncbi:thioredoxin family protein [Flavobacterium sp.]|uniref:thioredoxin family protein n=1 Tax=Flavobacterium sp. TaxID=239 RepID=UPI002FD8D400